MSVITLDTAVTHRDAWLAADLALATSQSYRISVGGSERQLTRADAAEVRATLSYWEAKVARLSRTRSGTRYVVPT